MKTNSRYDFMRDGSTYDEVSGSAYPDPISLNYSNFKMSTTPIKDYMSINKISFFWKEADTYYGKPCWDDVVLTLNGIPHKNFLKPKDLIYFPKEEDITGSFNKER